jgi:hypothetical integral membrane protein (TIGR02206 family)
MNTTTVEFYRDGFFGYSQGVNFHLGSKWHILPILCMIITIFLIYRYRKQLKKFKYESVIRYVLAFIMMMVEMSYFWRLLYVGSQGTDVNMMGYLPLQMCQWGLILCIFTLISKNKKLFTINFYITLLFASIALAYPIVIEHTGPRYYRYYQFWLEHILPIISVFYLMFVHKLKPSYKGIYYTFIAISPLVLASSIANHYIKGANYLYLRLKVPFLPAGQIYRIPILVIIVCILFNIMYFIFYLFNKKKKTSK